MAAWRGALQRAPRGRMGMRRDGMMLGGMMAARAGPTLARQPLPADPQLRGTAIVPGIMSEEVRKSMMAERLQQRRQRREAAELRL